MSYISGSKNGRFNIGSVKWHKNDENVMAFSSKDARNSFLWDNLREINGNIIFADPHKYIDIDVKIKDIEKVNYSFYRNDTDLSDTWYCCFVDSWEYIAPNVTRLYLSLDYFQQYFYDCTFYNSIVERAHIKKSDDIKYSNLENEPITATPSNYKLLGSDDLDWSTCWMLHTTSVLQDNNYVYGGTEGGGNITSKYVYQVTSNSDLQSRLKGYTKSIESAIEVNPKQLITKFFGTSASPVDDGITINADRFFDHTDEVQGVFARPAWCKNTPGTGLQLPINRAPYFDITLPTTLNGYTPKNNKLFSSLANGYLLYNENGLNVLLNPEFCTDTFLRVQCFANAHDTSNYKVYISRYSDIQKTMNTVSYNCQTPAIAISNIGVDKIYSGLSSIVSAVPSVATGVATSNYAGAVGSATQGLSTFFENIREQKRSIGSGNNYLDITPDFQKIKLYQITPSRQELEMMDDYLSTYGYAINEIATPSVYFNTRNQYNYIKVKNLNCNLWCPANDFNNFKSLFENGVRLWHNYNNFGQIGVDNN